MCASPDSTMADATKERPPCQYRYQGPVSSFPSTSLASNTEVNINIHSTTNSTYCVFN